jgi:hypothetical protein
LRPDQELDRVSPDALIAQLPRPARRVRGSELYHASTVESAA